MLTWTNSPEKDNLKFWMTLNSIFLKAAKELIRYCEILELISGRDVSIVFSTVFAYKHLLIQKRLITLLRASQRKED